MLSSGVATYSISANQLKNVETLTIAQDTTAGTVTLGATGITTLVNSGSTVALTFDTVSAVGALSLINTGNNDTTVRYTDAAVGGKADTVALSLSGVTGGNVHVNSATGDSVGVETISITSSGTAANSTTLLSNDSSVATVNIAGTAGLTLTLGTNVNTTARTVNGADATGALTISGFGAAAHTVTGGAGNDTFNFAAEYKGAEAAAADRDIINGGAGTDTVGMNIAQLVAANVAQTNLTSIEGLRIQDAWSAGNNFNLTHFADVRTLSLAAGTSGTSTATLASGTVITLRGDTANNSATTFTVAGTATNDTLTLNMAGFDFLGTGTETFNGVEALTINTGAVVTDIATFADALTLTPSAGVGTATITVTGANAMTFAGVVTGASTIDASALTGALTVNMAPAAALTIRGGSKDDTINGSTGNDMIVGGAGNDIINGAAGADVLEGGEGNDTISGGSGADTMTGGAGTNTFRFAAAADVTAGTPDTITDFDASATNILSFNGAAAPGFNLVGGNIISHHEGTTGSFAANNNVVVITTAVNGALTSANAATAIGSATANYAIGNNVLFIVSNNTDAAVFLFTSGAADATVTAAELGTGPIITLTGVNTAELTATAVANFALVA